MTMTMSETMAAYPPRPRGPEPRARLHSFSQMPTETITLSPAFIEALQAIAPRARRRPLAYLLALLALAAVVWAAVPAGAREGVLARVRGVFWYHAPSAEVVAGSPAESGATSAAPALERATMTPGVATLQVAAPPDAVTVTEVTITDSSRTTTPAKKAPKKAPRKAWRR